MPETIEPTRYNDRAAGITLAGASLLSILAMAHHPSGHQANAVLNQVVHGAMISFVLLALAGYVRLAARLELRRFPILLGLVVYAAGAVANLLAGTINGFVALGLYQNGASQDVLRMCWALNQACAYGAVYATSIAFLIWGGALVQRRGFARFLGAAGIAVALATAAALALGALHMNVAGAFIVYAMQAGFGVLAGAYLVRRTQ